MTPSYSQSVNSTGQNLGLVTGISSGQGQPCVIYPQLAVHIPTHLQEDSGETEL
jgi:hypothetical protein